MSTPTATSSRSRRRSGFTLVELTLALAMIAIIGAPLYLSLRSAFRARASSEAAVEPPRTAEIVMEYLRNDIQNALPPTGVLAGACTGTSSSDSRGHPADDLLFYTTADAPEHPAGNGEIKKVEWLLGSPIDNLNDNALLRHVTRNLLSQVEPTPDEEVICRGVSSFTLRYFDGSQWITTWDSTQENNNLPAAIEVTLELERKDPDGAARTYRYVRVFSVPCSTAAQDATLNSGVSL